MIETAATPPPTPKLKYRKCDRRRQTYKIIGTGGQALWDQAKAAATAVVQFETCELDVPLAYRLDEPVAGGNTIKVATLHYPRGSRRPEVEILVVRRECLKRFEVRS